MRSFIRKSSLPLSALLAAIAVASCQAAPPALVTPTAPQAGVNDATVSVDLAPLLARLANRRVLGQGFNEPAITQFRLRAKGPGMAESNSAPVAAPPNKPPLQDGPAPYHVASLPTNISLSLSSGVNRVFVLEGLDTAGHVLASFATLATLQPGAALALDFSAEKDTAARVLSRVLESDEATFPNVAPFRTADQTGALLAFVERIVGRDLVNTSVFAVNPTAIDREFIVGELRKTGTTFFGVTNLPAELSGAAWGRLNVLVTGQDGRTPYDTTNMEVTIFDPISATAFGGAADPATGEFKFDDLPRGEWAVRVTVPGVAEKWTTVTVAANTTARIPLFPAPTTSAVQGLADGADPAVAFNTNDKSASFGMSLVVWDRMSASGETGRDVVGRYYNAAHQPVGAEFVIAGELDNETAPKVCYHPGRDKYLVSWTKVHYDPQNGTYHYGLVQEVQWTGSSGALFGTAKQLINDNGFGDEAELTAIASPSGRYVVFTSDGYNAAVSDYTFASGEFFPSPVHSWSPSGSAYEPSLTYNAAANRIVLAWSAYGYGRDVFATTLDPDTIQAAQTVEEVEGATYSYDTILKVTAVSNEFLGGNQSHPAMAAGSSGTQQLLTWEDQSAQTLQAAWLDVVNTTIGQSFMVATGDLHAPSLALLPGASADADRYLLSWQDGDLPAPQEAYHTLGTGVRYAYAAYLTGDGGRDPRGAVKLTSSVAVRPVAAASTQRNDFVTFWSTSDDSDGKLGMRVMN